MGEGSRAPHCLKIAAAVSGGYRFFSDLNPPRRPIRTNTDKPFRARPIPDQAGPRPYSDTAGTGPLTEWKGVICSLRGQRSLIYFPSHGQRDAYGAVSLDDGATWNRTNLSKAGSLSSIKIRVNPGRNGLVYYYGDDGYPLVGPYPYS
jgi:hypothetical protein